MPYTPRAVCSVHKLLWNTIRFLASTPPNGMCSLDPDVVYVWFNYCLTSFTDVVKERDAR